MTFDPGPFIEYYRTEAKTELEDIKKRSAAALVEARCIAERILRSDPDVRRVVLFGSLAEEGPRRRDFDIDLAIDGGDIFKAMDIAEDSPFDVDILNIQCVPEHILKRIETKGVVLAAR